MAGNRAALWHLRWMAPLALLVLVGVVAARAYLEGPCRVQTAENASRPNVVVVVFDDLDASLAERLPGWRRLASNGVRFSNHYVTSPLCCPSRVSMLTGQLARNHGVYTNLPPMGGQRRAIDVGAERCTVAVWLDQAGYETALIGKYLNGYGYATGPEVIPAGWDEWIGLWGYKTYAGYQLNVNGSLVKPDAYLTDELADRAVRHLAGSRSPFFLLLTPYAPHAPIEPAPRHLRAPVPDGLEPGRYRMMLSGMDLLERVYAALPPNTYLFVTSDNGWHGGLTPGKGLPWDSDTRVPLLVLGPGLTPRDESRLVANIDLAPTLAEWSGVVTPPIDGRSLVPLLEESETTWREQLTLEMVGVWTATRTYDELTVEWADGHTQTRFDPLHR